MRYWDRRLTEERGLTTAWVQENESFNHLHGTLRGLHFQVPPHAETKLVRVSAGAVFDVFVDLRKDSETYGKWDGVEISARNAKMIYIPKGFAHGYCTLTDNAVVIYKVDEDYAPDFQGGIRWNDPTLAIRWPIDDLILSPRDKSLPAFDKFESPF
ncbi:MAG: dTDP-4-dehydrorhamnose 3,5-epimerase [Blastocatellia bacterium]|nr:dTDP-4-dehydrorhamnose 3,5-epimerase [Blastocatellia bacterium]